MKTIVLAFLLFYAMTVQASAAAAIISAQVTPGTGTVGEPLLLVMQMKGATHALNGINLQPLKADFYIDTISTGGSTTRRNGHPEQIEEMTVVLYPLRSGQLTIPSLGLAGHWTQPIPLRVQEASPSGTRIQASLSSPEPWVRQETTLTLDIYSDPNLIWTPVRLDSMPGLYVGVPSKSEQQIIQGNDTVTLHRYRWPVTPLRAGGFALTMPMLEATRFAMKLRYAVAPINFNAIPVPAYLPVEIPIGKLWVRQTPLPVKSMVDRPESWSFIVGGGMSEQYLRGILARLDQDDSFTRYPATITALPRTHETPGPTLQVTVPFRPLKPGVIRLPNIDLPYYDPQQGGIESLRVTGPSVEIDKRPGITIGQWIGAILSLALLFGIARLMRNTVSLWRRRRYALRRIREADTPQQLAAAVVIYAPDDGSGYRTLSAWLNRVDRSGKGYEKLCLLIDELDATAFGVKNKFVDLADLRNRTMFALRRVSFSRVRRAVHAEGTFSDGQWIYAAIQDRATVSEIMK